MDWSDILDPNNWFPVIAALVAGGIIGLERGLRSEPAGFRTHALVAAASAIAVIGAVYGGHRLGDEATASRVAQGVMTGIGFLGAGVIFREGLSIHGLTNAASVWAAAAIGLVFGFGAYGEGVAGTVLTLFILVLLRIVDVRLPRAGVAELTVRWAHDAAPDEVGLRRMLGELGITAGPMHHRFSPDGMEQFARVTSFKGFPADALVARLKATPGVLGFDLEPRIR
jgi:putative Mg2+ transporter-C (MgtC) family protein